MEGTEVLDVADITTTMKVSELIDVLEGLRPDSEVILAVDEEGNGYNRLAIIEIVVLTSTQYKIQSDEVLPPDGSRPDNAIVLSP